MEFSNEIVMNEIPTPATPASGKRAFYSKNDGKFYQKNSSGIETEIGKESGNSLIRSRTVNVSAAQIKALFTNPLELIPAIPGCVINVLNYSVNYTFVTDSYYPAYDPSSNNTYVVNIGDTYMDYQFGGSFDTYVGPQLGFLASSASSVSYQAYSNGYGNGTGYTDMEYPVSKGIYLVSNGLDLSADDGDSYFSITLFYTVNQYSAPFFDIGSSPENGKSFLRSRKIDVSAAQIKDIHNNPLECIPGIPGCVIEVDRLVYKYTFVTDNYYPGYEVNNMEFFGLNYGNVFLKGQYANPVEDYITGIGDGSIYCLNETQSCLHTMFVTNSILPMSEVDMDYPVGKGIFLVSPVLDLSADDGDSYFTLTIFYYVHPYSSSSLDNSSFDASKVNLDLLSANPETPNSGVASIFFKTDELLYKKTDDGSVNLVEKHLISNDANGNLANQPTLDIYGAGVTVSNDAGNSRTRVYIPISPDANAVHVNASSEIHGLTEKVTPSPSDEIIIEDAGDSFAKRRVKLLNLRLPLLFGRVQGSNVTTTGQTLVDILGLSANLEASSTYEFEVVMSVGVTAVTTGTQYGINLTSVTGASIEGHFIGGTSATASLSKRITAFNTAVGTFCTATSGTVGVIGKGIIITGATPPTMTVKHLKVTSGTSTVYINSYLKVTKIA